MYSTYNYNYKKFSSRLNMEEEIMKSKENEVKEAVHDFIASHDPPWWLVGMVTMVTMVTHHGKLDRLIEGGFVAVIRQGFTLSQ